MRKVSSFDGVTRADERLLSGTAATASTTSATGTGGAGGGAVSYPVPWFGPSDNQYWHVNNDTTTSVVDDTGGTHVVEDANKESEARNTGGSCVSWWLLPTDCTKLVVIAYVITKHGKYGDRIRWAFDDITDAEAAAGFCERTLTGLDPAKVYDIVIARSINDTGAKAVNPPEPFEASWLPPMTGSTPTRVASLAAWPNPVAGSPAIGYGPYSTYPEYAGPAGANRRTNYPLEDPETYALARIDCTNYSSMQPRVVAVGPAIKHHDGVYYSVDFKYVAGIVDKLHIWLRRVGLKTAGVTDYKRYGKIKRVPLDELTDAERDAGTCTRLIGPFTRHQARQTWHIVRINAVEFRGEAQSKRLREWYPADPLQVAGFDHVTGNEATSGTLTYGTELTGVVYSIPNAGAWPDTVGGPIPGAAASLAEADYGDLAGTQATDSINAQGRFNGTTFGQGGRVLGVFRTVQTIDGRAGGVTITSQPDTATERDDDAWITFSAPILNEAGAASTAAETNAAEGVHKFMRKDQWPGNAAYNAAPATYRPFVHHAIVTLDGTDTKVETTITGKKMGKRFVYIETVLRNAISKSRVDSAGNVVAVSTAGAITAGTTRLNFTAGRNANATYVGPNADDGIAGVQVTSASFDTGESNMGSATVQFNNIGVSADGDGDALEATTAVIPKQILFYLNRRTSEPPSGAFAPATLAQALNPGAGSEWRLVKDPHVADEFEYARLATGLTRQVHFTARRKRQHWACAVIIVKGSTTPVSGTMLALSRNSSELPNDNYAHGNGNQVVGGTFLFSRQDFGTAFFPGDHRLGKHWYITPKKNDMASIIDDSATNPRWDPSRHCLRFLGTGSSTVTVTGYTLLKKALEPGGILSDSFLARTNGFASGAIVSFTVGKADAAGVFTAVSTGFTITPALITAYRAGVLFGGQIFIDSSFSLAANENLWLKIDVTITSPGSTNGAVEMDNIMQVRGNQLLSYDFSPSESDDLSNTTTASAYSDSSAASIDAAGGGKNPDFAGGEVQL